MPRYFFNTEGDGFPPDRVGTDLSGPEEARSQAVVAAGEILKDTDGRFWGQPEWRMRVTDEDGAAVCILRVSGAARD